MRIIIKALQNISSVTIEHRRVTLSVLQRNNNAQICDLGCADGEFTVEVAKTIQATEVVGVDLEQENLERASQNRQGGYG